MLLLLDWYLLAAMMLQLSNVAKQLRRVSNLGSVKDAYHLLQGTAALTGSGKLPKPALLEIISHTVPVSEASPRIHNIRDPTVSLLGYACAYASPLSCQDMQSATRRLTLIEAAVPSISSMQGLLLVKLSDMRGNPVSGPELKGSIVKGKKGNARELQFIAKGAGQYKATLSGAEMLLGTHQ